MGFGKWKTQEWGPAGEPGTAATPGLLTETWAPRVPLPLRPSFSGWPTPTHTNILRITDEGCGNFSPRPSRESEEPATEKEPERAKRLGKVFAQAAPGVVAGGRRARFVGAGSGECGERAAGWWNLSPAPSRGALQLSRDSSKRKKEASGIPEWIGRCYVSGTGAASSTTPEAEAKSWERPACSRRTTRSASPLHRSRECPSRSFFCAAPSSVYGVIIGGRHLWPQALHLGGWVLHPPALFPLCGLRSLAQWHLQHHGQLLAVEQHKPVLWSFCLLKCIRHPCHAMPSEAGRERWIPWNWSYKQLSATMFPRPSFCPRKEGTLVTA
ncbi:protein CROC-4 [Nannospalax galili]|uniref:protein CROC-4 n=1 Tax=Nannospalax galili TaxID=1026970 RepID=UPI00111BF42C|nr:protein CROC-4 [Nannospalax galili]